MKKYNFDITVTDNTYAGGLELPYVSAALLGAETIAKGRCRLIEGVTSKAVVSNLSVANPIGAAACDASAGTALTLTEQVATLSDLMVNQTICRKTIFPTWISAQGQMQRNGDIPVEWTDFLLATVAAKTGEHLETLMWAGDSGAVFGTGFLSNDGVIDEAGIDASACAEFAEADTGTAWSADNILDKMDIVFAKASLSPAILMKEGAGFYMGYEAYAFFIQALAANNTIVSYNQDLGEATYLGYKVYPTQGIGTADCMVFTYPDNLVVATNNYTADTSAALIPVYAYDGSDNVKVKLHFAVGVQTAVPTDGVVGFNFT